jgi:hypothetical protein
MLSTYCDELMLEKLAQRLGVKLPASKETRAAAIISAQSPLRVLEETLKLLVS